jgi:hypothetical protein
MFGASSTLLNADHHDVYYKGMPFWEGRASEFLSIFIIVWFLGLLNFAVQFPNAGSAEAWGCF